MRSKRNINNKNFDMKKISISIIFCCICFSIKCQPANSLNNDLKLTIEVGIRDSQYILIPRLKVLKKGAVIQIHKRLYFGNENDNHDYTIYLQKRIKGVYVNLWMELGVRTRVRDDDWYEFRNFAYGDSINVAEKNIANLDFFCPLEVNGEYQAVVRLYYYIKGKRYSIYSEPYDFKVLFNSKNSMWDNN